MICQHTTVKRGQNETSRALPDNTVMAVSASDWFRIKIGDPYLHVYRSLIIVAADE